MWVKKTTINSIFKNTKSGFKYSSLYRPQWRRSSFISDGVFNLENMFLQFT